jgi:hypothetical protein
MTQEHQASTTSGDTQQLPGDESQAEAATGEPNEVSIAPLPDPFQFSVYLAMLAKDNNQNE